MKRSVTREPRCTCSINTTPFSRNDAFQVKLAIKGYTDRILSLYKRKEVRQFEHDMTGTVRYGWVYLNKHDSLQMNDVVIAIRATADFYLLFALEATKFKFQGLRKPSQRLFQRNKTEYFVYILQCLHIRYRNSETLCCCLLHSTNIDMSACCLFPL